MNIQRDNVIVERIPDVVILKKMEKAGIIIDVAIPGDKRKLKSIRISKEGF